MKRPASNFPTRYGPLPSGGSSVVASKLRVAHQCFGSTGSWPTISGSSRLVPGLEAELDPALARLLDLLDALVVEAIGRRALREQRLEAPDHVVGGDRLAVVPARFGPQREGDPRAVGRRLHRLREQPVLGERLVGGAGHQRVVEQADPRRRVALDDERIERVEGALGDALPQLPALRRVRVHVLEVREVGGIREIAVDRETVRRRRICGERGKGPDAEQDPDEPTHRRRSAAATHECTPPVSEAGPV